jgi:hypothetical protein
MKAISSNRIPLEVLLGEESPAGVGLTLEAFRVGNGSSYLKDAPDIVAAMANAIGSSATATEHFHINVGVQ